MDPGTITAYALLNLKGDVVKIGSYRNKPNSVVITAMAKQGKVFAVGTDVAPVPGAVQKIAKKIGARAVVPRHNLTFKEKTKLVDEFLKRKKERIRIRNKHEKDALAAAIYSLKQMNTLIKKIDDYLKQHRLQEIEKEVKQKVLLERIAIVKAVKALNP